MNNIRLQEILEETLEDLELQFGIKLSPTDVAILSVHRQVSIKRSVIVSHIEQISDYLTETPGTVWDCLQSTSQQDYLLMLQA